MSSIFYGLSRVEKSKLSTNDIKQITNNIGCLSDMASAVAYATADSGLTKLENENLAFTSALLAELIGELNGLLQTP